MGFSRSCFEQYKREFRILWRVLAVGALLAAGFHLYSVPLVARYAARLVGTLDPTAERETNPVEIVVVDEVDIPQPEDSPPPAEAEATAAQPAAAAEPSAPPLAPETPVPEPFEAETAESMDTVPTEAAPTEAEPAETEPTSPAIATAEGIEDGQGAAGDTGTVGLVPGSGSPTGDPANPFTRPNTRPRPPVQPARQPVEEVARARRPGSRTVACDPCSQPDYPLSERRDEIEGQPVISVIFDQNGRVVEAEIETSSGNAAFDRAALEEARENWRFRDPYGLGGQVSVDVTFVIDGSEQAEAAQAAGRRASIELPVQQAITPVRPESAASPEESPPPPDATDTPEPEAPETETPDTETLDTETLDTETLDTEPDSPETPASSAESEPDESGQADPDATESPAPANSANPANPGPPSSDSQDSTESSSPSESPLDTLIAPASTPAPSPAEPTPETVEGN